MDGDWIEQKADDGAWDEVTAALEEALGDRALALYNRGILHKRRGQSLEAWAAFDEACRLDPGRPEAWNELGLAAEDLGRPRQAEQHYRRALDLDPNFAPAWNNWGVLAFLRAEYETARERFERALASDPDLKSARLNLEDTLEALGGAAP